MYLEISVGFQRRVKSESSLENKVEFCGQRRDEPRLQVVSVGKWWGIHKAGRWHGFLGQVWAENIVLEAEGSQWMVGALWD